MPKTILTFAAHNDDQVIGAGGTLAKYAKEGVEFKTIVFSYGESSHPHLKSDVIIKTRIEEADACDKVLGGAGVIFLKLKEGAFDKEIKEKKIEEKLAKLIKKENPIMVFAHGIDDAHPDHRAVHRCVMRLIKNKKITCPAYSFDIWSLVRLRKRNVPRMVVDVGDTFTAKVKSLLEHKSQKAAIALLLWKLVLKDWFNGVVYGYKYAEVFYRLK